MTPITPAMFAITCSAISKVSYFAIQSLSLYINTVIPIVDRELELFLVVSDFRIFAFREIFAF